MSQDVSSGQLTAQADTLPTATLLFVQDSKLLHSLSKGAQSSPNPWVKAQRDKHFNLLL